MLVDISIKDVVIGLLHFSLRLLLAMIIVAIALAWVQMKRIKRNLVDPVNSIALAAKEYVIDRQNDSNDIDHFASLDIHTGDEIENLTQVMAQMEKDLAEYEENLARITAEKERISTELSLGKSIQASMLPHEFPPFPDRCEFDIYATMEPAREVGGDFYDYFLIDDDHLGIVMADVSGKGIPAALFKMTAKTILQSCAMLGRSASETLSKTNEAISSNNQTDMFVTAWFGILEISSGQLTYANAGHEYPALRKADGDFVLLKEKHGFVIGGMEGTKYNEYTMQLMPGDKFFIYTDGIPEAADEDGNMYKTARMIAALNRDSSAHPKDILVNVREDIREFVKNAEQFDDMTMLCIEYLGK